MKDTYLGVIVARKGSKGIKNKNYLLIDKKKNKRLIDYTFSVATNAKSLDAIVLTTNDKSIIRRSNLYNLTMVIKRSEKLSGDSIKTVDVVIDAVNKFKKNFFLPNNIVLLQPTSPLRKTKHIEESIKMFKKNKKKFNSLVSVTEYEGVHPLKLKKISKNKIVPFVRGSDSELPRQKLKKLYFLNGLVYIIKTKNLLKNKTFFDNCFPYFVSKKFSLNLDSIEDLRQLKQKI